MITELHLGKVISATISPATSASAQNHGIVYKHADCDEHLLAVNHKHPAWHLQLLGWFNHEQDNTDSACNKGRHDSVAM